MPKPLKRIDLEQRRDHANKVRLWEAAEGRHTGPKTAAGRFKSGQRSRKHGLRSGDGQALARWLASVNRLVRTLKSDKLFTRMARHG